ncbi:MAG: hypothetical protein GX421_10630 [Caldisericales bacterium]|nr:hypothetical protein [Caldisericales bacterium]
MKTPKEYLIGCEHDGSYIPVNEVLRILTQIQKEAWNEALDKAAESADVTDLGIEGNAVVDLNSILKLKL